MRQFRLLLSVGIAVMATAIGPAITASAATPAGSDVVVATFESDPSPPIASADLIATISTDTPAEGRRCLTITAGAAANSKAKPFIRLTLPQNVDPAGRASLTAAFRVQSPGPLTLRWQASNAAGQPLFLRRFSLSPAQRWVRIDEPLRSWRWSDERVGDWDEVKQIALIFDSPMPPPPARLDIDDVCLVAHETIEQRAKWLTDLAFPDRPIKQAGADGLLVATDAVDAFTDAQLQRQLDDMRRARAFMRRAFGDAVRPTDQHDSPIALLIFKDADQYPAFEQRFGKELRVEITPPTAGGYTVQDVAASTYRPDQGPRRPVYLHESVHAMVARDVRLLAGHAPHTPLQEAVANYVQIAVFPNSIPRDAYAKAFAKPLDPSGAGFFKPLEMLFAQRVTTAQYAQLASVFAYLLDKDPKLLSALAKGLADGSTAADVLAARRMTWQQFQAAWLAWGKQRFPNAANATMFLLPAEFR